MDIDWTQIRGAIHRIERQLSRAREVIKTSDEEALRDWPEVTKDDLQAAYPRWESEYGKDWMHGFMEKRIGRENFRVRPGGGRYRIAPRCWEALRHPQESPGERPEPAGG